MNNSEDDVSLVGPTVFNYGKTDELKLVNKQFYVEDFTKRFSCDQICFSYQATYRKFCGALITSIANTPVFTKAQVVTELSELQQQGCKEEFSLVFTPELQNKIQIFTCFYSRTTERNTNIVTFNFCTSIFLVAWYWRYKQI